MILLQCTLHPASLYAGDVSLFVLRSGYLYNCGQLCPNRQRGRRFHASSPISKNYNVTALFWCRIVLLESGQHLNPAACRLLAPLKSLRRDISPIGTL